MIAFFESPFEQFLFLDADTVVCGDLNRINELNRYHFIVDKRGRYDDNSISKWFFDTKQMEEHFPNFAFGAHREDYFCTGVFMARRNAIRLERYLELLELSRKCPNFFKFWEMGILNFMIFEAVDLGHISVLGNPYQLIASDHRPEMLKATFESAISDSGIQSDPVVFHFPSPKSYLFQTSCYSVPMTFFRKRFAREFAGHGGLYTLAELLREDFKYIHYPLIKSKLRSLIKRSP